MQTWEHEKGCLPPVTCWMGSLVPVGVVLVGGDMSVSILEVLGAARAEEASIQVTCAVSSATQCTVLCTVVGELKTRRACVLWL